jgi:hypothetical protein
VGLRRRVHQRTQLHAFAQKGASGECLADLIKDRGPILHQEQQRSFESTCRRFGDSSIQPRG